MLGFTRLKIIYLYLKRSGNSQVIKLIDCDEKPLWAVFTSRHKSYLCFDDFTVFCKNAKTLIRNW